VRTYLFDDKRSFWHAVIGAVTAVIPYYFAIPVVIGYTLYEVTEPEDPTATVGDMVEFIIGFMIGIVVHIGG